MSELVSIIIPIYNVAPYLRECLDSVLAQDYLNTEIILINDGSTDGSDLIAKEYATKSVNIFLFSQENRGLSAARNLGIDNAKGTYLCFIDSDDYIHSSYVSILLESCIDNDVLLSICSFTRARIIVDQIIQNSSTPLISREKVLMNLLSEDGVTRSTYVSTWNKLFHKDLFTDCRFPIGRIYEDNFCIPLIFEKVKEVAFIDLALYHYRIRKDSITTLNFPNELTDQLDGINSLDDVLARNFKNKAHYQALVDARKTDLFLKYYYHSKDHKADAKRLIIQNLSTVFRVLKSKNLLKFFKLLIKLIAN